MKENFLSKRFQKIINVSLTCRIVTPMFLGDARQGAALRAAPFKGLLRYWWRVAAGSRVKDYKKLLERETEIFGGGGEKAQKSLVRIWVEGEVKFTKDAISKKENYVIHPEVDFCHKECLKENPTCRYKKKADCQKRHEISPFSYLGGMGLFYSDGFRVRRPYLAPGETFTLNISVPKHLLEDNEEAETFKTALLYFRAFGAVGSRSRNGWGSFQVEGIEPQVKGRVTYMPWKISLFEKDYPYALGAQKINGQIKPLLWRTKAVYPSWEDAMRALTEIYIEVRTQLSPDGTDDIDERHLLGFPLTNHPAKDAPNWGSRARHASPLRLLVRRKPKGYVGFVLHIPFGISNRMRLNASGKIFFISRKQYEIWQKVHERLDQAMQRASINECL